MSTTLTRADEPIAIHTRVFKGDDGWYYELRIWKGNVDINTAKPTIVQPEKPFRTKRAASDMLVHEVAKALGVRIPGAI